MSIAITPLGAGVYSVVSSPVQTHRVDLRAWNWNGQCTCETFSGCCLFLLTNQEKPKRQRCPHILAVREWVMENEYPDLVDQSEKIIELPTNETRIRDDVSF